ncbi:hypothetical protein F4054_12800 [Candidatus Poribacteria bacterium]|nr:hypothetical protein [Candidatus Poribacteria bacterium]MYK23121.1 hypothetical protein [Candidatus Poribacteria bacterium]
MRFEDILDTTFSLYRKHFSLFLGLVVFSILSELGSHLLANFSQFFFHRSPLLGIAIVLIAMTFFVIGIGGIVIGSCATYLCENVTIRSVLQRTMDRFWPLLGCLLLWLLVVTALTVTVIGIPFAIYFAVRWGFFIQTIMFEKPVITIALGRSGELVKPMWWRVFGMLLAILLLSTVVHAVIEISIGFILVATNLVSEVDFIDILEWGLFGVPFEGVTPFFHTISIVIHLAVYAISFPIWIIGITLLYFNQRIRIDGFDIEMQVPQPNTDENSLG